MTSMGTTTCLPSGGTFIADNKRKYRNISITSTPSNLSPAYNFMDKKLEEMLYRTVIIASINDMEIPSDIVITDIKDLLYVLKRNNITLSYINPINEGGILLEFENSKGFFTLEYSNNEEIAFLFRDKENKRWAYDLDRESYIQFISDRIV
jgi:hypothetical protein